jgi:hypothetical protein
MHVLRSRSDRSGRRMPDSDAPILWQVAVCRECITDLKFAAVKHQRTVQLARDMSAGRCPR